MPVEREKLSQGIPLLKHKNLVFIGECGYSILKPSSIPVHPEVYKSPQFYTTEFAQKVLGLVPDSIRQDIVAIEAKLGQKLPVVLTPEGISEGGDRIELFKDFHAFARSEGNQVTVEPPNIAGATNIYLRRTERSINVQPVVPEKLARKYEYKLGDAETKIGSRTIRALVVWNVHNLSDAPLPVQLALRNFAIMFNNLALQELGVA
jgi:hypothetical protein